VTIVVSYTCDACGLKDIPVTVPPRGTEDVVTWMEGMRPLLVADHQKKSPDCHPRAFTHVKIPFAPGSERVGEPTKQ
jgi:hypothetical protein